MALFQQNSGSGSGSKNLVEFKCGKMSLSGTTVTADKRKGLLYIYRFIYRFMVFDEQISRKISNKNFRKKIFEKFFLTKFLGMTVLTFAGRTELLVKLKMI